MNGIHRSRPFPILTWTAAILLASSACQKSDDAGRTREASIEMYAEAQKQADEPPAVNSDNAKNASPAAATPGPLTDTEVADFARAWVDRIHVGGANLINALIDWDGIERAATADIECPEDLKRKFLDAVRRQRSGPESFDAGMAKLIDDGGSYHLLRQTTSPDGKRIALFRVVMPKRQGVNYHEMEIVKREDGQVRAADVLVFRTGLTFADILRNSFLDVLADDTRKLTGGLKGRDKDYVANLATIRRMQKHLAAGEYKAALDDYAALSPAMKKDKVGLILRIRAADGLDLPTARAAIDAYRAALPNAANTDLLAASVYMDLKQFDRALFSIDQFDRRIGGDPYLDVLRAYCLLENGDVVNSREIAIQATNALPDLRDGYWARIDISLKDRRFLDTIAIVEQFAKQFGTAPEKVFTDPVFANLVKSNEYRNWLAARASREAALTSPSSSSNTPPTFTTKPPPHRDNSP